MDYKAFILILLLTGSVCGFNMSSEPKFSDAPALLLNQSSATVGEQTENANQTVLLMIVVFIVLILFMLLQRLLQK